MAPVLPISKHFVKLLMSCHSSVRRDSICDGDSSLVVVYYRDEHFGRLGSQQSLQISPESRCFL